MTPDGTGRRVTADSVDMEALAFVTMAEDRAGNIWLGTNNGGIVRIDRPDGPHVRARIYSDAAGGLNASKIMSLCVDASGRLWAGTDGGGLDLYDPDADTFVCVQTRYELPGDVIHSIVPDADFDFLLFAQAMNVSKTTLFNKLKSLTGMNTSAFVRHIRLVSAMNHLRLHGASVRISELAYSVGFNDPRYFSTCFKKEFGMLPSEVTPEAKNSGPA